MSKITLITSITKEEAINRLTKALIGMGLTFLDCIDILEYEEDCETAYWSFNPETKKEKIVLGPEFVSLPLNLIQMALRHEVLHRTTYNSFAQRFQNSQLANIVFDTCINRMLYISFPDDLSDLASRVYSIDTHSTMICLPNPLANKDLIPDDLKDLWKFIWEKNEFDNYNHLSATSLYYKLEETNQNQNSKLMPDHMSRGTILSCGGGCGESDSKNIGKKKIHESDTLDDRERANQKTFEKLATCSFKGLSSEINGEVFEYSIVPMDIGMKKVKEFLNSIMAAKIASKVVSDIKNEDKFTERLSPILLTPSRKGMVYLLSGISNLISLYHNRVSEINYSKLALGIYIDMSGSMEEYFPVLPILIKHLSTYPIKIKGFTDFLYDLDLNDIKNGIIKGGGNTDFNPIFEDLINDVTLHAGLIITDGMSAILETNITKFKSTEKKLYQILFSDKSLEPLSSIVNAEYLFKYLK